MRTQRKPGLGAVAAIQLTDRHVGAVAGEGDLGQGAGEAAAGLDHGDEAARGQIDAFQHSLPIEGDFPRQPVAGMMAEEAVVGEHPVRIAVGLELEDADLEFVQPQMKDRVIEFAGQPQRPERGPLIDHSRDRGRRPFLGPGNHDGGGPRGPVDLHRNR